MVGSLPVAWFEMTDDFYGAAEFPCDLYFMDLNGTWNDPDGDGKFSKHPTCVEPEIWIGRLWTPTAGGNDAALINNYFRRNHLYRKGLFGTSNKALAFVDDDWGGFGDCAFDSLLPAANIEIVTDTTTTDGDHYKAKIQRRCDLPCRDRRIWRQDGRQVGRRGQCNMVRIRSHLRMHLRASLCGSAAGPVAGTSKRWWPRVHLERLALFHIYDLGSCSSLPRLQGGGVDCAGGRRRAPGAR